jgi:NAD(P)-dependent dehydrogenase (short-subunit alcohol dehydrogenase family)
LTSASDSNTRGHAVVVGGSGMLAGTCLGLARRGWLVSVVGRDPSKLARLARQGRGIDPISVDYRDHAKFRLALEQAIERHGSIEVMVCWIRSSEPEALRIAAEQLSGSGRLVHVLGSAAMLKVVDVEHLQLGTRYSRVVLGATPSGGSVRWLTHEEISAGVLVSIDCGHRHHVVGQPEAAPGT